jgi:hypothetical protein
MTEPKREPFAMLAFEPIPGKDVGENYSVVGGCAAYSRDLSDEDFCRFVNAAFNARVDEEVRKAVEDFRERAAKLMEDPDACPEDIRRLPTEPERGKE